MSHFIQNCLRGEARFEDIDDYISEWHRGRSRVPLHTFLGMTRHEYAAWIENPDTLACIVVAHSSTNEPSNPL